MIERLIRDRDDRPVELVYLHFRADRYRYGMTFRPTGDGDSARVTPSDLPV